MGQCCSSGREHSPIENRSSLFGPAGQQRQNYRITHHLHHYQDTDDGHDSNDGDHRDSKDMLEEHQKSKQAILEQTTVDFEQGTRKPPAPPPLVPNANSVYNLIDEGESDDVCPTCLEEYTKENPKITLECQHTFHLSCIYEWLERSAFCPICATRMRLPRHEYQAQAQAQIQIQNQAQDQER
mmetsp:Transcript_16699/g.29252  ORF Transcript_16699/g.29252 Transcript_16699/m.29252 type:complete len:183 (+) Transcript_16699:588-1136(+)